MKLTLTIHDERVKPDAPSYATPKTEEYVHTEVTLLAGRSAVIADTLRAIANEIDPPQGDRPLNKAQFAQGGIVR